MTTKEWVSSMEDQNGNVYEGQMVAGPDGKKSCQGYGTMTFKGGAGSDSGEWHEDRLHGLARSQAPNGCYTGLYANGEKSLGSLAFGPNGAYNYTGFHKEGVPDGDGILTSSEGRYTGEFKGDRRHGNGMLLKANGQRYIGSFVNQFEHGFGVLYDGEGATLYTGQWVNGHIHGQGKFRNPTSGIIYEGAFLNNLYHGEGVLTNPDGSRENATYINGK